MSHLLLVIVTEALSREFRATLPWDLLYANDLVAIVETHTHTTILRLYGLCPGLQDNPGEPVPEETER